MCGLAFNRSGTLCSACKDGFYPLIYSFDSVCIECPGGENWWKFVLIAFLPLTVFYFIVFLFKENITSSHFHPFICYAQALSIPVMLRILIIRYKEIRSLLTVIRVIGLIHGMWNLDFFRSINHGICLGTDSLQTLGLNLAVGIYPLVLMMLSFFLMRLHYHNFIPLVVIWKPFRSFFSTQLHLLPSSFCLM